LDVGGTSRIRLLDDGLGGLSQSGEHTIHAVLGDEKELLVGMRDLPRLL
jgi:hypothetical protein